jgi:hypothetical protein
MLYELREGDIDTGIADSTVQEIDQSFESLNTSYKRNKFYSEKNCYSRFMTSLLLWEF